MKKNVIRFPFGAGITLLLSILLQAFVAESLDAQTANQTEFSKIEKEYLKTEVSRTRKDYQRIVSRLDSYKKKDVRWEAGEASPGSGTTYTGYFDPKNKLALLKYTLGEEGYWSEYEYYFRDEEIFFIYIHSGDPGGGEKEERIYITSKLIIQALLKVKAAGESKNIGDLENMRHNSIMDNAEESSRTYLISVETELRHFKEAVKKATGKSGR